MVFQFPSVATCLIAAVLTGAFDSIDLSLLSMISDVGRAMAFVGGWTGKDPVIAEQLTAPVKMIQEGGISSTPSVPFSLKENIETFRTKLFGIVASLWVMAAGVTIVAASVMTAPPAVEEDILSPANSTIGVVGSNSTVCEEEEEETDEGVVIDTSRLASSTYTAQVMYAIGLFVVSFLLVETTAWSSSGKDESKVSPLRSFKLLFGTPWLRLLTACLMITDACQIGYLTIVYWFSAYEFGWSVEDYSLFLVWCLICQCIATTVCLSFSLKKMGLFGTLIMSCTMGIVNLFMAAISGLMGSWFLWLGMTGNMFLCHKPLLRAKICAEFSTNDQGKVMGGVLVANTLSQMAGSALVTALFTWAVTETEGEQYIQGPCNPPARNLIGGLPFFALMLGACATLVLILWGRRFDPAKQAVAVAPVPAA
jgi:hypothetical protein